MNETVGAVLLAAGAGSRLGHRAKSLLMLDGVPLIRGQIAALFGAGVVEVVVVIGHYAAAIEAELACLPVKRIINPNPDAGQGASLRIGLRHLSAEVRAVIVALADQPLVTHDDVSALIHAFDHRVSGASMVVPQVANEPGNPVMIEAALRDEWLSGESLTMGRDWREANPSRVQFFDTENAHFRVDIDTPEDITTFNARFGRTLGWPDSLPAEKPTA